MAIIKEYYYMILNNRSIHFQGGDINNAVLI